MVDKKLMATFSGALRLVDLDDFITPSQVKLATINYIKRNIAVLSA